MFEPITSYLSQKELEELYEKYGKPGEIAPGIPAKKSKVYFFSFNHGEQEETIRHEEKGLSDDAE